MEKDKLMELKTNNDSLEYHHFEGDNIVFKNELTVTITLAEYRALVYKAGTANGAVKSEREARWKAESERDDARLTVKALKSKLEGLEGGAVNETV